MPITLLDGILIGFTLVSAVLAMVRGFSREVLSVASWVAAAAAAYFFYPTVLPFVKPHIENAKIALGLSAAIVFFIALIIVTVITMKIADFIIDSRVGALDRTLGFLYGAARGVLVVAVALLFFDWLIGDHPPNWVSEAKSRPLLEGIGQRIEAMLPADPEHSILKHLSPGSGGGDEDNGGTATPPADNGTATPPDDGTTNG